MEETHGGTRNFLDVTLFIKLSNRVFLPFLEYDMVYGVAVVPSEFVFCQYLQ